MKAKFTTLNTSARPDPLGERDRAWKPDLSTYKNEEVPPVGEDTPGKKTSPTDFSRIALL